MGDDLMRLAERCEQATGPSYELDCAIWDAIYPGERDARFEKLNDGPYKGRLGPADRDGYIKPLRAFTASLDAAMTLVPEDWRVAEMGETVIECDDPWQVKLLEKRFNGERPKCAMGDAATPALALCAAALRAKSEEGSGK